MSDLANADVTVVDAWTNGGTNGRRNKVLHVKFTNTTAGGGTNRLLATAFGLTKILRCSNILLDATAKAIYPAVPSADGSEVLTFDPTESTDGDRATPADIATSTDYAYITVEGV